MATRQRIKQSILTKTLLQGIESGSLSISEAHWRDFTDLLKQQEHWLKGLERLETKLDDTNKEINDILMTKSAIGAFKKQVPTRAKTPRPGKG